MLNHPNWDPVAISFGPVSVHWYGITYVAAFAMAWWLARLRTRRADSPVSAEQVDDLIFYGALGVVIGGRLGSVFFYNFDTFLDNPLWLFKVWEGGMAFHGGLIGVITAMYLYARQQNIEFGRVMDFVAPIVPFGLGSGRIGNFIGQELYGRETDVPWAMLFASDPEQLYRHPSQLYQAFLEGVVLLAIVWWFSRLPRPKWSVGALFMIVYGIQRFVVEFFRQPDAHIGFDLAGVLTRGQLLCVPMVLIGLAVFIWAYRADGGAHKRVQASAAKLEQGSRKANQNPNKNAKKTKNAKR